MRLAGKHVGRLAAALLSAGLGCLLELPAVCGDGHLDPEAEACDPAIEGGPPCDPVLCTPIEPQPVCGDGKLDPGEACDGSAFGMKTCPTGEGFLVCTADCQIDDTNCNKCGNGRVDVEEGEECDPNVPLDSIMQRTQCSDLTLYPDKPYTSGVALYCLKDCLYFRGPCGYCGDEKVDPPSLVDLNFPEERSAREVCDGRNFELSDLKAYCEQEQGCTAEGSLCAFKCNDTCEGFEPSAEQKCCLPAQSDCPEPGDPLPCCAAYDAGLDDLFSKDACTPFVESDGKQKFVCRR